MKNTLVIACLAVALALPGFAAAADPVPVIVAVDTSRSLSTNNLTAISNSLSTVFAQLPPDTPVGLIGFNDQATWLQPIAADTEAVTTALAAARPAGNFTVLHDALFLAARELTGGGVILVVTDGRDENSATTVDDVARLCESQQVRILTAGVGRRIDDRALRRFALLSEGEHLGAVATIEPEAVSTAVIAAQNNITANLQAARPPTTEGSTAAPTRSPTTVNDPATEGVPMWVIALVAAALVLALLLVAALVWMLGRRKGAPVRVCDNCGSTLEEWESSCSHCQMAELEEAANSQQVATTAVPDESVLDPAVFEKAPIPAGLDQTMVLDEQPVLITKQRGQPPRTYALPRHEIFAVGRAPEVNTLQLDDPTVSAQHFKVVPKEDDYYVVDLGTTNGTSVNHERVSVKKLAAGDIIQVGLVEFEFRMKVRRVS